MFIEIGKVYRRLGSGEKGRQFFEELVLVRAVRVKRNPDEVTYALMNAPGGWVTVPRGEFEDKFVVHEEKRPRVTKAPRTPERVVWTPQEAQIIRTKKIRKLD